MNFWVMKPNRLYTEDKDILGRHPMQVAGGGACGRARGGCCACFNSAPARLAGARRGRKQL